MTKKKLVVIKIGGNVLDNEAVLQKVLDDFASIKDDKILIHGGGKIADVLLKKLDIKPNKVNGRRITDADTLDTVTMVYAGLLNKKVVAQLQARDCNALGLTGADGGTIKAHKRTGAAVDYGYVGDVDKIKAKRLKKLLKMGFALVFAPITADENGQLLNTNADTVAQALAVGLADDFRVVLKYVFEKKGVLADPTDDDSVISKITLSDFEVGKANGSISDGMIPKLTNAFEAMREGVASVVICGTEGVLQNVGTRLIIK